MQIRFSKWTEMIPFETHFLWVIGKIVHKNDRDYNLYAMLDFSGSWIAVLLIF